MFGKIICWVRRRHTWKTWTNVGDKYEKKCRTCGIVRPIKRRVPKVKV